MEAIKLEANNPAQVDRDRCIGCGLFAATCHDEAVRLHRKPDSQRRVPPVTGREYLMQVASIRGKSLVPLVVIGKSQG